jgi:MFS family permease
MSQTDLEQSSITRQRIDGAVKMSVLVAALGYFVDIYDLLLFSIVRKPSLVALGFTDIEVQKQIGAYLLNMQMGGMLLGGIAWGILGDRRGRLSVLFGSIFLYSIANIANGFVHSVDMYGALRLVAGFGLAGELGAGITLVSEIMHKDLRGYGTTLVAAIGILGAVVASLVGKAFDWRVAYFVGGGLGLVLLILRINIFESGMFSEVLKKQVSRGNFLGLFTSTARLRKYVSCILAGLPTWFSIGILITFSDQFGRALGMPVLPNPGDAVMYTYIGASIGGMISGLLSQRLRSRKKVMLIYIIICAVTSALYLTAHGISLTGFYFLCFAIGFGDGYWAILVTMASEQFGTNIRATVTTTVPNFVRGAVVPLVLLNQALQGAFGVLGSGAIVGAVAIVTSLFALMGLDETFHKDLDYVEEG